MVVQYSLLPNVYICAFLFVCIIYVHLSTCGQSNYLWSRYEVAKIRSYDAKFYFNFATSHRNFTASLRVF